MSVIRKVCFLTTAAAGMLMLGCEGDFVPDPMRPRPTRALSSPVEQNSASGEMTSGTATGTSILSVEFPNTKEEHAKVRTIVDQVVERPAARPAPATQQAAPTVSEPARRGGDPILGPQE